MESIFLPANVKSFRNELKNKKIKKPGKKKRNDNINKAYSIEKRCSHLVWVGVKISTTFHREI